jgi:alkanesulfonate monooxygenase SsuD/methylene tetrahydromethanopterin reductase-like flavin-dependent oxidoreductase (luciferase family)
VQRHAGTLPSAFVRYGISVPNFGDPAHLVELGHATERAGWDGFFLWDHVLVDADHPFPIDDPWVVLGAVAQTTERVRLGTLVTPVARRRPWKLARETVTLDHLSGGRAVLGVGLGEPPDAEFGAFGEPTDGRVRAELLDEGLEVLFGLWSGERFSFKGRHLTVDGATFLPTPLQSPRIPVWVAVVWPNRGPLRRAAQCDGMAPIRLGPRGVEPVTPDDVREMLAVVREQRETDAPFDVAVWVVSDTTAGAADYEAVGVTWLIESASGAPGWLDDIRGVIDAGPGRPGSPPAGPSW